MTTTKPATTPVRRGVEFIAPGADRDAIAQVQAEVVRVLDAHAIVHGATGRGPVLIVDTTFASEAEVDGLVRQAHHAALRVTPCDVRVLTPKRR